MVIGRAMRCSIAWLRHTAAHWRAGRNDQSFGEFSCWTAPNAPLPSPPKSGPNNSEPRHHKVRYEVRNEADYFDEIPDVEIPKDMLELASHIVKTKAGHFDPDKFEDQYEDALNDLLKKKQEGKPIEPPERREPARVINLMDALRRSVEASGAGRPSAKSKGQQPATQRQSEQPKGKKAKHAS
jgi:hypothetical protein